MVSQSTTERSLFLIETRAATIVRTSNKELAYLHERSRLPRPLSTNRLTRAALPDSGVPALGAEGSGVTIRVSCVAEPPLTTSRSTAHHKSQQCHVVVMVSHRLPSVLLSVLPVKLCTGAFACVLVHVAFLSPMCHLPAALQPFIPVSFFSKTQQPKKNIPLVTIPWEQLYLHRFLLSHHREHTMVAIPCLHGHHTMEIKHSEHPAQTHIFVLLTS